MKKFLANDDGAAVAESTMIMALIVTLLAGLLQFGVIIHTRNTMIDAASAGARHATLVDRTLADGQARAEKLLHSTIPRSHNAAVRIETQPTSDGNHITVVITHQLPLVGFLTAPVPLKVSGHAYEYPVASPENR